MRVHDTRTGKLHDRKAHDPPYAILSHTWNATEQSFHDVQRIQDSVSIQWLLRTTCIILKWFLLSCFHCILLSIYESTKDHNLPSLQVTATTIHPLAWILFLINAYYFPSGSIPYHWRVLYDWMHELRSTASSMLPLYSILNDARLSEKIRKACAVARLDQFSQIWVDTSCIDKKSSSELSEAINSMFAWYRDAAVCYVYMADVPHSGDPRRHRSAFRHSRWFTRGWTLQELIAPRVVIFLSREWEIIGTKESLVDLIEDITGIHRDVLMHRTSHNDVSVAARMSWAAERTTTRIEDRAYCLLGLFGIVLTPIYGEGEHAFRRLQAKILRRIPDDSIFAWEMPLEDWSPGSRSQAPSLSLDAASPQFQYMRLLDTTTGRFVDHPADREVSYAVFTSSDPLDFTMHRTLLRIHGEAETIVLRYAVLRWSLATSLFFLRLFASALEYSGICHTFQRWVCRLERWILRYGSILDDPGLPPVIRNACTLASRDGHSLLWMESACVNSGNTPEFSMVLNSYYAWLRSATLCSVYLPEVPQLDDPRAPDSAFRRSRWFKSYATLSHLIAPRTIVFLSNEWGIIGTKESLADLIEDITGIDRDILTHNKSVHEVSIAERVSWMARRSDSHNATRPYFLSELFDITMTFQFGENKERAFRRFMTKVLRRNLNDKTLDALENITRTTVLIRAMLNSQGVPSLGKLRPSSPPQSLLAPSPSAFLLSGNIRSIPRTPDFYDHLEGLVSEGRPALPLEYTPSSRGIHTKFQLIALPGFSTVSNTGSDTSVLQWYLAILSCERAGFQEPSLLARLCYSTGHSSHSLRPEPLSLHVGEFVRQGDNPSGLPSWRWDSLVPLLKCDFGSLAPLGRPEIVSVCIPHTQHSLHSRTKLDTFGWSPEDSPTNITTIMIPRWIKSALGAHGYCTEDDKGSNVLQTSTISLHCMSVPLIMRLRKCGQEAAIVLPIRSHPLAPYQRGWSVDDQDGTTGTLSCGVVPSSDPGFEVLTSTTPSHLQYGLLIHMKNNDTLQWEWKVGEEILRPILHSLASNHYILSVDIIQA